MLVQMNKKYRFFVQYLTILVLVSISVAPVSAQNLMTNDGSANKGGNKIESGEKSMSMQDLVNPAINKVEWGKPSAHAPLSLIEKCKPLVAIVIPTAASASVQRAAADLADGFRLVTGSSVAVKKDNEPFDGCRILIDDRISAAKSKASLPEQGFQISSSAAGISIIGDSQGVLNGVCDFQERILGIRWYYPGADGTAYKPIGHLVVPPFTYSDYPRNVKREMWPWWGRGMIPGISDVSQLEVHPIFQNAMFHFRSAIGSVPRVDPHGFPNFGMYAKEYPECFELNKSGERNFNSPSGGMPCYGNPMTLQLHVDALKRFFTNGDKSMWLIPPQLQALRGAPTASRIAFSPPDNAVTCKCPTCQAMVDDNPSGIYYGNYTLGSYSKVVGAFAANLAREIKKNWPDKVMTYLPYWNYTEPPQGVEFPDNVHVMVCLMYGVGMSKDPEIRDLYTRWIKGWNKIIGHPVTQWEYICWPENHSLPIVCLHTIRDFKQITEGSTSGSFINGGSAGARDLPGGTWAVGHIVIYGLFRTLWNSDYDVDAMLDEYLTLMYGPASGAMGNAIKLLQDRWEKTRLSEKLNYFSEPKAVMRVIHDETMPWGEALKLQGYIKDARTLAGNDSVIRRRVDFFGRGIDVFLEESALYHGKKQFSPTPALHVRKVTALPVCDGNIDDAAWKTAAPPSNFSKAFFSWTPEPGNPSSVRAVWNDEGVAFAFQASEENMEKLHAFNTKRADYLWDEDSFELFVDRNGKKQTVYQLVANALGAWWDLEYRVTDGKRQSQRWILKGVQCAASKDAKGWNLEIIIPFSAFGPHEVPAPGDRWNVNFARNRFAARDKSIQRWNTRYVKSNADFDSMGVLVFE